MKKLITLILSFLTLSIMGIAKAKIGVTLLPYYSYVSNIVDDKMEVVTIIPENVDVHSYSPSTKDMQKLLDLDYIVVNGIGHDDFVYPMIEAIKKDNKNLKVIYANTETALLDTKGQRRNGIKNPHTFISIQKSIEQVNYIAKKLSEYDSKNKKTYVKNAINYSRKLRKIKREELKKLDGINLSNLKVATTHAGYDYLLNEFGMTVSLVVEPSHAQNPNTKDLKNTIEKIKEENIQILFDELGANPKNANILNKETGIKIAHLSHLTTGKYEKDAFEKFIKEDFSYIVDAIKSLDGNK
ncbi:metal ABC transporter solute-binding protein, Zn/Mn family [Oceanivirga miroungae]|uniref:Manganese ABC transporter, manganese-binding adhesion liprotein n=1 Tax=Oceanivirga miroungae TaxID=1130046 RepID=A0A6I8M6M0_9FUSO|nr:zinc ABC transporter substrate-binding protein [Oceanivirga miroungae]VWL85542.1 manganese ABC transporter, manganese-binding adhesion liprotein [Oceanivirga miroungae]